MPVFCLFIYNKNNFLSRVGKYVGAAVTSAVLNLMSFFKCAALCSKSVKNEKVKVETRRKKLLTINISFDMLEQAV